MELVDSQQWIVSYGRLKNDYQQRKKYSPTFSDGEAKDMFDRLTQLEKQLSIMKSSPMEYEITVSEIGRRQVILESLRKQITTASTGGDSRMQLLASTDPNRQPNTTTAGNGDVSTFNPMATSDKALLQRQREVMKMQDEMLGDIEKGVDRLHNQAREIGKEAQIHTKILDELDVHVDEATDKLKEETKHAEYIKRATNDCYAYLCIAIEAIVLFILLLVIFVHI